MMDDNLLDRQIYFSIACVSEFAKRHGISEKEAFAFLERYDAMQFLKEFYEVEHTLSFDDVVDDMERICMNNGGYLDEIISR